MPSIDQILLIIIPFTLSLCVHEFAHARVAFAFGDPTAKAMGRMTLNPLVHLDVIGTISLIFVGFGWAKPVPVNPLNLYPRRIGDIMVSLAGPLSNIGLALISGVFLKTLIVFAPDDLMYYDAFYSLLYYMIGINLMLFTFNLIPLFPLDGHHIVRELLPADRRTGYMRWQVKYGNFGLIAIVVVPTYLSRFGDSDIKGPVDLGYDFFFDVLIPMVLGIS